MSSLELTATEGLAVIEANSLSSPNTTVGESHSKFQRTLIRFAPAGTV
jgi:hypothetical protein